VPLVWWETSSRSGRPFASPGPVSEYPARGKGIFPGFL
jgi:hypothetical protein